MHYYTILNYARERKIKHVRFQISEKTNKKRSSFLTTVYLLNNIELAIRKSGALVSDTKFVAKWVLFDLKYSLSCGSSCSCNQHPYSQKKRTNNSQDLVRKLHQCKTSKTKNSPYKK